MAGRYSDDEPSSPWTVCLYVDDRANLPQHDALTDIFLGRAGGQTFENFAAAIGKVEHVRRARISLSHVPRRWWFRAADYVTVSASRPVDAEETVACGIPGLDRPGQEVFSDRLQVHDEPLKWDLRQRCGFATDFSYVSFPPTG